MRNNVLQTIGALGFSAVVTVISAGLAQASPTFTITATNVAIPPGPPGHACTSLTPGSECWEAETGQSMPSGTVGYLNGLITVNAAGVLRFTYGANLLPGDTGHGNSAFLNEFWVGANELAAEALGQCFATQLGTGCPNIPPPPNNVGDSFSVAVPAGALGFGFTFGATGATILNGQNSGTPNPGAYLATCAPTSTTAPNGGPCTKGYIGLTDAPYFLGGDHDFQDLVVTIDSVPEPGSLLLLGFGLMGVAFFARWRKDSAT